MYSVGKASIKGGGVSHRMERDRYTEKSNIAIWKWSSQFTESLLVGYASKVCNALHRPT